MSNGRYQQYGDLGNTMETINPWSYPDVYDAGRHDSRSVAAQGKCSWHGSTCAAYTKPVISFRDPSGNLQSGCQRARRELFEAGWFRRSRWHPTQVSHREKGHASSFLYLDS